MSVNKNISFLNVRLFGQKIRTATKNHSLITVIFFGLVVTRAVITSRMLSCWKSLAFF